LARWFWEVVVLASPETSEGLTNLLWETGAMGVVEEETPGWSPRLRAFFPGTANPNQLTATISGYVSGLRALGFWAPGEPVAIPLQEEMWAEAWRQTFVPRAVGQRLLVAPPWEIPPLGDGRRLVVIEPGQAFGTGNHASTLGCLTLLESSLDDRPVARALDIGTGTGILAIAAAVLGVPTATALDTDPHAIIAARGNIERNGLGGRIDCRLDGPETFLGPPAPLILANLLAPSHRALGTHYGRLSSPGAHLILGGILTEEREGVVEAMASHGFVQREAHEQEGWVSLLLAKTHGKISRQA
jgi:ribosomal protein L11 methyltransferase